MRNLFRGANPCHPLWFLCPWVEEKEELVTSAIIQRFYNIWSMFYYFSCLLVSWYVQGS